MATARRSSDLSVAEALFREPYRFEFFQAVRLLHLIQKSTGGHSSGATFGLPRVVSYRTHLALNYPACEIQDLKPPPPPTEEGKPARAPVMKVNFMGLTGPSGVLPRHYTEFLIARRQRYKDDTAHRFFDLFNHRIISLFVQAWEKYRSYIGHERGRRQTLMQYLLDLVGMGTRGLRGRLRQAERGIHDEILAYYAGLNAQRPHSAAVLSAILQDYFGVGVSILQFQGQWLRLEPSQCTRLGRQGGFCDLGDTAVLGDRVWDQQAKFRVRIGPLNKPQFDAFLPDGSAFVALKNYVRWFVTPGQNFDIQLVLRKDEVPDCRLSSDENEAARLGWSSWLKDRPFLHDADDAVLTG